MIARTFKRATLAFQLFGVLVLVIGLFGCGSSNETPSPRIDEDPSLFAELSGFILAQDGQSFIAISDRGLVAELDSQGQVLRRVDLGDLDLEAIARDPAGRIWVAEEREDRIFRLNESTFAIDAEYRLTPSEDREGKNTGHEGMAFEADGTFWLANERPPILRHFRFEADQPKLLAEYRLDGNRINDLVIFRDALVVLSKKEGLRAYDRQGRPLGPWQLHGIDSAEALIIDPEGRLTIGGDEDQFAVYRGGNFEAP